MMLDCSKGFGSKFYMDSQVQHERPEKSWRTHRPEHCEYNNENEDNSLNIPSDKTLLLLKNKFWITLIENLCILF